VNSRAWAVAALLPCALACSSPALVRPTEGDCSRADARFWLDKATTSLVIHPYQPKAVYDQDARNRPVPVTLGNLPPDSTAALSYPYPQRFEGGQPGFLMMRGRSFVYDDALVALWLTSQGDRDGARRILQTLAALQRPDGAWGFGFQVDGDGFYNASYVRTGTCAWALYALARWQKATQDQRFQPQIERGVRWLLAQKHGGNGLYDAGVGRWTDDAHFDPAFVAGFAATEHQIDAWFALQAVADAAPELDAVLHLRIAAADLAGAIERGLWLQKDERYAQGRTRQYPDFHSALDASGTWAALYALAAVNPGRAQDVLAFVQEHHPIEIAGWQGLRPYQDEPPDTWFVEGSLARPLALHRLGQTEAAQKALQPFADLACAGGVPLVYSPVWAQDFPLSPATAPTVWFLFTASEIAGGQAPFLWNERARPAVVGR
jgi:hypothetical protein